jgi:calcineurin-like phosphoesterase family protein
MNNLWFTSDYHFYHENIIKYENRPFIGVDEMNNTIISRHNDKVKKDDTVYFLGDFCFYASENRAFRGEGMPIRPDELKKQLNGHYILISGNHDKRSNKINISNQRIIINKGGIYINLIHRPHDTVIYDGRYYYPLTLCGHVHGKWLTKEIERDGKVALIINVSVETNNYYPYSFNEIMSIYWKWLNSHSKKELILTEIEQFKKNSFYQKENHEHRSETAC